MSLQMMVSSVAPPGPIRSGICSRRHTAPCNLGLYTGGLAASSTKLTFSSSFSYPTHKDVVLSLQASEINLPHRLSMHAVTSKAVSYIEVDTEVQDLKSYIEGDLTLTLESDPDVTTLDVSGSEKTTSKSISEPGASPSVKNLSKKGKNVTQLNSSATQIRKLDFLQVFKYPLGTESAVKAMLECNTLVFVVDKRADKKIIKDAAKNMFKIGVKKVNTAMTPDGTKKAYLMLAKDYKAADVAKKIKML